MTEVTCESDEFTARVSNETRASKGDRIRLAVEIDGAYLFDQQSGETIF